MNELTYTRCGDYYIPDLKLSEQPEAPIGKYGRMRQRYLKEHRPGLYSSLILSEMLYPHAAFGRHSGRYREEHKVLLIGTERGAALPEIQHPVFNRVKLRVPLGTLCLSASRRTGKSSRSRSSHQNTPS